MCLETLECWMNEGMPLFIDSSCRNWQGFMMTACFASLHARDILYLVYWYLMSNPMIETIKMSKHGQSPNSLEQQPPDGIWTTLTVPEACSHYSPYHPCMVFLPTFGSFLCCYCHTVITVINILLHGGFNPSEKICKSQIGNLPLKIQKKWNHHLVFQVAAVQPFLYPLVTQSS